MISSRITRAEYSDGFWVTRSDGSRRFVGDTAFNWREGLTRAEIALIGPLQRRYAFGGAYYKGQDTATGREIAGFRSSASRVRGGEHPR